MQSHEQEWKEKQKRLEQTIKKMCFYKQNGPFEKSAGETGGVIPNSRWYLEEDESQNDEEWENESEHFETKFDTKLNRETGSTKRNKQFTSNYIVLIITEYIKKKNVLENLIAAYKTVYDNIEYYYKSISKKEDIDFLVENYFLKKSMRPDKNAVNSNQLNNRTNLQTNETGANRDRHVIIRRNKLDGINVEKMEDMYTEMETYTVSVVLKLKKSILCAVPALKDIIENLKTYKGKYFYINNRIGIIERWKQQIYEYVCAKKNMFAENKNIRYYGRKEEMEETKRKKEKNKEGVGSYFDTNYNKNQGSFSEEIFNNYYDGFSSTHIQNNNNNNNNNNYGHNLCNNFNHQGAVINEKYKYCAKNSWVKADSTQKGTQNQNYENKKLITFEDSETEETDYMTNCKRTNFEVNDDLNQGRETLLDNYDTHNIGNYKIYEINITTDTYMISLKSILTLIELIVLLHLYFRKCELEQKINKNITSKQLHEYVKSLKNSGTNYELFYSIIQGRAQPQKWKEKHNIDSDEEAQNFLRNIEASGGSEGSNDEEESFISKITQNSFPEKKQKAKTLNEPTPKKKDIQKSISSNNWMKEQQHEQLLWDDKKIEEMHKYIKYLLENIIHECEFFFSVEILYTLNIFHCFFFFSMFKNLLLQKKTEDSFLIILTYCAYRTNNKEMISHCFWRLISVLENDTLPSCWMRRDDATNGTNNNSNNSNYQRLNNYAFGNNYYFTKSSKELLNPVKNNCYSNSLFYETLNIMKDESENSICEIDVSLGNMYCKKHLIDKSIFSHLVKKVKKQFNMHNKIPNGYIINEVQRIRNFSEFYSCCYVLKNNKKEKILMGFKKKGENKVFIYKYDKNIKKKYKESKTFFHMEGFLGVLVCSFTGMKIKIFDNGVSENYANFFPNFKREHIITLEFDSNIISELPRHFVCTVHKEEKRIQLVYENKCPIWNEEKEMYELPFYGRVKLASAKNLQLILKKCIINVSLKKRWHRKNINDIVEYIINQNNQKVAQAEIPSEDEQYMCQPSLVDSTVFPSSSTKNILYAKNISTEQNTQHLQNNILYTSVSSDHSKQNVNHKDGTFEIINTDEEEIYLIFGKNSKDSFTLDFRHPLTTFEAFAVGISSLLKKKAVS